MLELQNPQHQWQRRQQEREQRQEQVQVQGQEQLVGRQLLPVDREGGLFFQVRILSQMKILKIWSKALRFFAQRLKHLPLTSYRSMRGVRLTTATTRSHRWSF